MFSQWLGEQDELFKFISAPCDQQQPTMLLQKENELELLINRDVVSPSPPVSNVLDHSVVKKPKTSRRRKLSSSGSTLDTAQESPKECIRKILHRDVERQRRQEMACLYHNLRSKIPAEHLPGKRSISNHIHMTTKYIMHMKNKIDELNSKKETLLKMSSMPAMNSSASWGYVVGKPGSTASTSESDDRQRPIITVKTCTAGIEITANLGTCGDHDPRQLSLSKIIKILVSKGISVKSCTSTRVHDRQLHVIQSEVNEGKIIDSDELYKKLMETCRN